VRDTGWFKSSRSTSGSDNCVEVRVTDASARVRDSKNPGGGELMLDRATFTVFVEETAAGR
jgi:hypothetical protein